MRGLTYGFDTRFPCIQERTGTARLLRTHLHSDISACISEPTSYILCSHVRSMSQDNVWSRSAHAAIDLLRPHIEKFQKL